MYKSIHAIKKKKKKMTPSPGVTFIRIIRIQVLFSWVTSEISYLFCVNANLTTAGLILAKTCLTFGVKNQINR